VEPHFFLHSSLSCPIHPEGYINLLIASSLHSATAQACHKNKKGGRDDHPSQSVTYREAMLRATLVPSGMLVRNLLSSGS